MTVSLRFIAMPRSFVTHLRCSGCSERYSISDLQTVCPRCSRTLLVEYDLAAAQTSLSPEVIQRREGTLWRYRELLPVVDDAHIVSLGEGWTPLIRADRLGRTLGLERLLVKEEGYNPTGSFKARGLCLAVSRAKELGVREAAMPSAGNAGGALAAYAARAGISAHVFMPADTPSANIIEVEAYGASVRLVEGVISDAGKRMVEESRGKNWFDMSTMKEPYRLEGKKTMGYEIAEQMGWRLPDVIVYPTGGGTGLIGMWKAFSELETLGWITGRKPKMVSVQAAGCAPIVKAFKEGKNESEFWNGAETKASGLRVPKAFADALIMDAIYASGGCAVAVSDEELLADMKTIAAGEGLFFCPEGAATVSAARRLLADGFIKKDDVVVLFNTGSGYKYMDLFAASRESA